MTLLPATVADERFKQLEQIIERLQALNHEEILKIYFPQIVNAGALPHLAEQFNVAGLRGYFLADTEAKQRTLIENAIELNRRSGTAYAVLLAMESVGYPNVTIEENPPLRLDGDWTLNGEEILAGLHLAAFIITLDPVQSDVSADRVQLLIDLINEWKPASRALLDLRIADVSLLQNLLLLDGTWQLDGDQEIDGEKNI